MNAESEPVGEITADECHAVMGDETGEGGGWRGGEKWEGVRMWGGGRRGVGKEGSGGRGGEKKGGKKKGEGREEGQEGRGGGSGGKRGEGEGNEEWGWGRGRKHETEPVPLYEICAHACVVTEGAPKIEYQCVMTPQCTGLRGWVVITCMVEH